MPSADPTPSFTPFRLVVFLAGIVSIIAALPSVSPDVKVYLSVGAGVLGLILSVFFDSKASVSFLRGVMNRVRPGKAAK